MADRSMSVQMTLNDLGSPDARNLIASRCLSAKAEFLVFH